MFCKYCGNELTENANFCPSCGKFISESKPATEDYISAGVVDEAPNALEYDQVLEEERDAAGRGVLKFAILGIAFACSFFLSLLGLIFAIVSRAKLGAYLARYGETRGPATVGKHLGIAGLITSIVMIVFFSLYVLIIAAAIASGM